MLKKFQMAISTYLNGHISVTGRPIHFMFCSRVEFSGTNAVIFAIAQLSCSFNRIAFTNFTGNEVK